MLSLNNGIEKSKVTSWIRSKVNFAPLKICCCVYEANLRQMLANEKLDIELEHASIKNSSSKLLYKQYFLDSGIRNRLTIIV